MFNSMPSNIIFILVVVVIFVVRTAIQSRKKPEKKPPQVRIPVHFEDEKKPAVRAKAAAAVKAPKQSRSSPALSSSSNLYAAPSAAGGTGPVGNAGTPTPVRKDFASNLSRLSPLKQAVVMAEILGPPKGLQ